MPEIEPNSNLPQGPDQPPRGDSAAHAGQSEDNPASPAKSSRATFGIGKLAIFSLIALVLILAAIEISLRVVGFQFVPPSDFAVFTHSNPEFGRCIAFDPETLYRLKPGAEIDHFGHAYQINSQGWRSPDFKSQKPANTCRIVAIGDSNVLGYRLPPEEAFTGILGRLAGEKAASEKLPYQIEVINCGVLGWSSFQVRQALEHYVFDYEPDVVIVYVGAWNEGLWAAHSDRDQWAMIHEVNPRGLFYQSRLVQLMRMPVVKRFRQQHIEELLAILKESNAGRINQDWDRRVSFEEFGDDLRMIANDCEARGIPVIFLSPILRPSMEAAREALEAYRGELANLPLKPPSAVIDLRDLTNGIHEDEVFLEMDPVHFRPAIHDSIAREIFWHVEGIMANWDGESEKLN